MRHIWTQRCNLYHGAVRVLDFYDVVFFMSVRLTRSRATMSGFLLRKRITSDALFIDGSNTEFLSIHRSLYRPP